MSGIVAVFRRDGAPVDAGTLDRLHDSLAYRGHDAAGTVADGPVGLGHQALWTTPEAVGEQQPIAVGDVRLAMAGRLDDRGAFVDALPAGLDPADASDARLLAAGYREYGLDCLDRAVGPLAVALWDADRGRLVCARGKTGIRQLFVAETPEAVVVGSDVATVRAHPAVEGGVDGTALSAYLAGRAVPSDGTFEAGIRRLRPGTRLVADADGVRERRYWHPADPDLDLPADPDALAAELRERLRAAVAARLRCRDRPGLLLSGGLDSTTVAGVAAADLDGRPRAYSLVFEAVDDEKLTGAERERLRDVRERHGLDGREVVGDDAGPLSDPSAYDRALATSPCLDPLTPALDSLYAAIDDDGTRVALTGHGGNALNGTRFAYADLLRRGRVVRLAREVRDDWMRTRESLLWYALVPAVPKLGSLLVGDDGPDWLGDRARGVDPVFGGGLDCLDGVHRRNVYAETYAATRTFKLQVGRQMTLARGIDLRMPYYDPRVVAFAYAVPSVELVSGGAKSLFREAVGDVLPPSVRRIRKGRHYEQFVAEGLRRERATLRETLSDSRLAAEGYVADDGPGRVLDRFLAGETPSNATWRLYAAERWLARAARRRDAPGRHAPESQGQG